nr:hypothetical protein [Chlamydiota bacterium]
HRQVIITLAIEGLSTFPHPLKKKSIIYYYLLFYRGCWFDQTISAVTLVDLGCLARAAIVPPEKPVWQTLEELSVYS